MKIKVIKIDIHVHYAIKPKKTMSQVLDDALYTTTIAILQYLSERTVRALVTHTPLLDHSPVINHLRY